MTREEIDKQVDGWMREELAKDAALRADPSFAQASAKPGERLNEVATYMWQQDASLSLERWQEVAKSHDWAAAEPIANLMIRDRHLPIEKGSEPYQLLCMALVLASGDVQAVRLERSEGRWTERPRFGLSNGLEAPASPEPPSQR